MILSEGKVKLVKLVRFSEIFNSCFLEYINNTNYMYISADNEEEGLNYYQMRQPVTTWHYLVPINHRLYSISN